MTGAPGRAVYIPGFARFQQWLEDHSHKVVLIEGMMCSSCGVAQYLSYVNDRPVMVSATNARYISNFDSDTMAVLPDQYRLAVRAFDNVAKVYGEYGIKKTYAVPIKDWIDELNILSPNMKVPAA